MIIKKGTIVDVKHVRSGNWRAIATKTFDTAKEEFYPLALYQEKNVHGLNTSWEQGEDMPARNSLCTVEVVDDTKKKDTKESMKIIESMKTVLIKNFGKDHWSLLAYVEYRAMNHKCVLDNNHLRSKLSVLGTLPGHTEWKDEYGTKLSGYWKSNGQTDKTKLIENHDDFDCLDDLEAAGLLENVGTMVNPYAELTDKGRTVMMLLSKHKQEGKNFADFKYDSTV